jgi:outer membrane immunogenic protein
MLRRILLASAGVAALTGAAAAADLGVRPPPPPYVPPPPPPMWTGFYAGLNAGYGWSSDNSVRTVSALLSPAVPDPATVPFIAATGFGVASVPMSGFIGGGQVGYNYQFVSWPSIVVGIEADIQGAGIRGHGNFAAAAGDDTAGEFNAARWDHQRTVDWLGTVRGRLGWLFTPTLLVYGTGGFAYGGVTANSIRNGIEFSTGAILEGGLSSPQGLRTTRAGWTAGGGLEWMFMPNWSLKAEALYFDLGRATFNSPWVQFTDDFPPPYVFLAAHESRFNGVIARAGLNYHFWWGAPPVVAKY